MSPCGYREQPHGTMRRRDEKVSITHLRPDKQGGREEFLMSRCRYKVPAWLRDREPEPWLGAFREFVEGLPRVRCCPFHRQGQQLLLACVQQPAGRRSEERRV